MSRADYFTWEDGDVSIEEPKEKADAPTKITNARVLDAVAANAVNEYMPQFTKGIAQTSYDQIKRLVNNARRDGTGTQGVLDGLTGLFGPDRAQRIAITETTRLFGLGSQAVYKLQGIKVWQWSTANDPWVCEQCLAKQDELFGILVEFEPEHPGCRCWPRPSEGPSAQEEAESLYGDPFAAERAGIDLIRSASAEDMTMEEWRGFPTAREQLDNWARANNIDLFNASESEGSITLDTKLSPGITRAKQIASGITDARASMASVGINPDSIHWEIHRQSAFASPTYVADTQRLVRRGNAIVRINIDSEEWGPNGQQFVDNVVMAKWWPGPYRPGDTLVHEAGHIIQKAAEFNRYPTWLEVMAEVNRPYLSEEALARLNPVPLPFEKLGLRRETVKLRDIARIVRKVSDYASKNPHEFVAETYFGLYAGNKYPSAVMTLYEWLGGEPVKPRKR